MRRFIGGLVLGAVAVSLAACSTAGSTATPGGGSGGTIDGTSWILKTYDVSGTATAVPSGSTVDAHFAGVRVNGFSGCNSYAGPAIVSGATIKIGPLAGTQMACQEPAMTLEQAYLAALGKAATFTATSDALTMFDSGGKTLLTYAAAAANPLEGSWNVTGYNNGKEAVVSPVVGSTVTAVFSADTVSGSTGCNDYNGPYTLDGTTLKIGPLASTMKACEQALMDQEQQFLTALQAATTFSQSGPVLTLKNDAANQVTLSSQ